MFTCECALGFSGHLCEVIGVTSPRQDGDPCTPNPCLNQGSCQVSMKLAQSVNTRAANEHSSLGVRGGLGLYSSPF